LKRRHQLEMIYWLLPRTNSITLNYSFKRGFLQLHIETDL